MAKSYNLPLPHLGQALLLDHPPATQRACQGSNRIQLCNTIEQKKRIQGLPQIEVRWFSDGSAKAPVKDGLK